MALSLRMVLSQKNTILKHFKTCSYATNTQKKNHVVLSNFVSKNVNNKVEPIVEQRLKYHALAFRMLEQKDSSNLKSLPTRSCHPLLNAASEAFLHVSKKVSISRKHVLSSKSAVSIWVAKDENLNNSQLQRIYKRFSSWNCPIRRNESPPAAVHSYYAYANLSNNPPLSNNPATKQATKQAFSEADSAAKVDSAAKTDSAAKIDSAAKTDSTAKVDCAAKVEYATKVECAAKADSAAKVDCATKVDCAAKADSAVKADSAAKTDSAVIVDSAIKTDTSSNNPDIQKNSPMLQGFDGTTAEQFATPYIWQQNPHMMLRIRSNFQQLRPFTPNRYVQSSMANYPFRVLANSASCCGPCGCGPCGCGPCGCGPCGCGPCGCGPCGCGPCGSGPCNCGACGSCPWPGGCAPPGFPSCGCVPPCGPCCVGGPCGPCCGCSGPPIVYGSCPACLGFVAGPNSPPYGCNPCLCGCGPCGPCCCGCYLNPCADPFPTYCPQPSVKIPLSPSKCSPFSKSDPTPNRQYFDILINNSGAKH